MGELLLLPTGAGDVTAIQSQYPSSGQHYDKMDDPGSAYIYDRFETYVREDRYGGDNFYDLYKVSLPEPPPSGSISSVKIHSVFASKKSDAEETDHGIIKGHSVLKTHGQVYFSSWHSASGWWSEASVGQGLICDVNPFTGASWTWSEVASMQIGTGLDSINWTRIAVATKACAVVVFWGDIQKEGADSFALVDSGVRDIIAAIEKTGSDSLILTDSAERIISPLVPVAIFVIKERRTERLS